jgi:Flp pilus assembly protein TadB
MPPQAPPSIKDLLAKAVADSKRLATAQFALTKAEVGASGQKVGVGAGLGIATLALLFFAVLFLLVTLALVLVQLGLQPWAGFLIVAGVIILCAVITALLARKSFNDITPPNLAIAEFEKTKAALSGISAPPSGIDAELPPVTGA